MAGKLFCRAIDPSTTIYVGTGHTATLVSTAKIDSDVGDLIVGDLNLMTVSDNRPEFYRQELS